MRARNKMAKELRAAALSSALELTYGAHAMEIFGFQPDEETRFSEQIVIIREILQSFINKPAQQAIPAKFGEDFDFVRLIFPQFLARALKRHIYVYSMNGQGEITLTRTKGFNDITGEVPQHDPVMITHNGLTYEGVQWEEGMEDFLVTIDARMRDEESVAPLQTIEEALAVTFYLYAHTSTREFI